MNQHPRLQPIPAVSMTTKMAAVYEALRLKGALPGGSRSAAAAAAAADPNGAGGAQGSHGGGGIGGVGGTMLHCDPELAGVLGASSFPFSQLEEALGPHVEPAESPSLVATVS